MNLPERKKFRGSASDAGPVGHPRVSAGRLNTLPVASLTCSGTGDALPQKLHRLGRTSAEVRPNRPASCADLWLSSEEANTSQNVPARGHWSLSEQAVLCRFRAEELLRATPEHADAVQMTECFVRGVNWAARQRRAG